MNIDSVTISENGDYITLVLPNIWDIYSLERALRKVKTIAGSMKVNRLLITSDTNIFNKSMEEVLDISILFSELADGVWKIAIVSKDNANDWDIFESAVALHGLKTSLFDNIHSAEIWF
jgi:hypothetical protein